MPHDEAYYKAEKEIQEAQKSGATELDLSGMELTELPESIGDLTQLHKLNLGRNYDTPDWDKNRLTTLPESLGRLTQLQSLDISYNQLTVLPESLGQLTQLQSLSLNNNQLTVLPEWIGQFTKLVTLMFGNNHLPPLFPVVVKQLIKIRDIRFSNNKFSSLPEWIGQLKDLETIICKGNQFVSIPSSLAQLEYLTELNLGGNPLNPELAEAYKQGLEGVKVYLRASEKHEIILNQAKLILVGEGEVGKTCLMDAMLDKEWQEHSSTHGIETQQVKVAYLIEKASEPWEKNKEKIITLNAWDFGGQRVYRPTHQLFFSAPAVYLVVWKPREGSQAGQVKEWIQLVKRREPSAKILVVATHGGPQQRQPDIDRQELWDLFGVDTVVDFFFVDSKPDEHGNRKGIDELKRAITQVAASLPEVGRSVPKSFADVRQALQDKGAPYLPLREVLDLCRAHNMDDEIARLFITISHRLGHLTHYENDPTLRDIVILRPDWLATAMSYVLDDEATRAAHGLVKFSRLSQLWDDKNRADDSRYPATLHPIFLRLMERFDLSYKVAGLSKNDDSDPVSLIAQLVPDIRPQNISDAWKTSPTLGDIQQTQICHIVDASNGQSASAEGLFYQLIVRLHKYSLGRADYNASVHWQRGLVLEDDFKSRAFLEHVGNDVRITVRSPYPEGLLGMLTREVKFLVESFWEGLRCDVMVPCIEPCGKNMPGTGLYNVSNLIESKREGQPKYPCPACNKWQDIDSLLRNAPAAAQQISLVDLQSEFAAIKDRLYEVNAT
ncbi:MAG: hypothetical protein IH589_00110, partial [Anaerolineales bacterium]|nr:hypothetical protein [Anaerolineales bacterium]